MNDFQQLVGIATAVVALAGGVKSAPLINWIKNKLGVDGRRAQAITVVMAVVVAAATQLAAGAITPEHFQPERIVSLILLVLVAGQAEFNRLK